MNNLIENDYAKFWIEKDILFFVYKNGVTIDLKASMEIVKDRLLLQQGKSFLIFCDIRGIKTIDKNARNYLAIEGSVLIEAVAVLSNTPLTITISDFYIKTSVPSITTKEFIEKSDAFLFLNSYKSA